MNSQSTRMFYGSAPLFLVTDIVRSVDYYCDVLGFDRPHLWGDPVFFAMPKREEIIIMLQQRGELEIRNNLGLWDAYFWVRDAASLFKSMQEKGALVVYEPEFRSAYGCYEFAIEDPDGYRLAFGQEYEGDVFFELNPVH